MADAKEGAAAPNQRPGQNQQPNQRQGQNQQNQQQQNQDAAGQQHLHINWSYFKPEFSGKPEKDAEAHLLFTNDWMNVHHFHEDMKVQRICLTLLGETRLWFQSIEPLENTTWPQLQYLFRQRHGDHSILMRTLKP